MPDRIVNKTELEALVQRILDLRYDEDELPALIERLVRSTGCPTASDLIFYPKRPTTAAEIVDAALAHQPIVLGDRT